MSQTNSNYFAENVGSVPRVKWCRTLYLHQERSDCLLYLRKPNANSSPRWPPGGRQKHGFPGVLQASRAWRTIHEKNNISFAPKAALTKKQPKLYCTPRARRLHFICDDNPPPFSPQWLGGHRKDGFPRVPQASPLAR